jgi:hypothetical protein
VGLLALARSDWISIRNRQNSDVMFTFCGLVVTLPSGGPSATTLRRVLEILRTSEFEVVQTYDMINDVLSKKTLTAADSPLFF